jgi:hypothetical protein
MITLLSSFRLRACVVLRMCIALLDGLYRQGIYYPLRL